MRKLFLFILLTTSTLYSQNCTELFVNMYDSYGDGWNGNYLTVAGQSVTLESGSVGVASICVDLEQCNYITVDGGY